MAKTWYQKQQEKERNKKASAGGAAENTGAESDPVGSSPAAPVAQDNLSVERTASSPNVPDRTRLDNQQSAAEQARKPVTGAATINHDLPGVPSREEQEKESEAVATEAPAAVPGGAPANVMAASGDASKRVAHSAPGGTITTKEGTFTRAEWEEKNKKPPRE